MEQCEGSADLSGVPEENLALGLIESQRADILQAYARALEEAASPLAQDPAALSQAILNAEQILDDVASAIRTGVTDPDDAYRLIAWEIGASRAQAGVHPEQSLVAASVWFGTVVRSLAAQLASDPQSLSLFMVAVLGLERSINMRIRESSASYASFLLNMAREARTKERRSIVRELHDRIGYGVSVAQRHLELFDLHWPANPTVAVAKVEMAQQAIQEMMLNLRALTSDLYPPEPLNNLEKALVRYIESTGRDEVNIRLQVNGDETWAKPIVLDESFLVLREAARNALSHGSPSMVLIRVDIAPHELRGSVKDDGVGFTPQSHTSDGVGLITMRERAHGIGGQLLVTSRPGNGTDVELFVPF
jgi:signal transduction histidine kinase